MGVVSLVTFAFGGALSALIGYLFHDSWRWQLAVLVFPLFPYFIIFIFLLPESPLWLHSNFKYEKAEEVGSFLFPSTNEVSESKFPEIFQTSLIKSEFFFHKRKLTSIRVVFRLNRTLFTHFKIVSNWPD